MVAYAHVLSHPAARQAAVDIDMLWVRFGQQRAPAVRDQLVAAYSGFARILAAKAYARRAYNEMEFADYLQYAMVGLLESLDRFDVARGIKFETFASRRIAGAIMNGIESSSEVQEQIAARRAAMSARLGSLTDGQTAPATPDGVFARLAELAIGLAVGFALEGSGMNGGFNSEYGDNSYHGVELKQLRAHIMAATARLPAQQRLVIHGHYLQHLAFDEVASTMRLSRGRVAQIHKEALGNLRARLQDLQGMDLSC